jgi:hypothetical protein
VLVFALSFLVLLQMYGHAQAMSNGMDDNAWCCLIVALWQQDELAAPQGWQLKVQVDRYAVSDQVHTSTMA